MYYGLQVSLNGTNMYDASAEGGATAWDTAALNPRISPLAASSATATLPCYASDQSYLGGDSAFGGTAWGSAANAGAPVEAMPPLEPDSCYTASGDGAFWQVRGGMLWVRSVHSAGAGCGDLGIGAETGVKSFLLLHS